MDKKTKSKSEIVVEKIIEAILNGSLKAGDKLPVELELAKQFSVSRITIREAFKRLNLMGIVEIKQGDGSYISQVQPGSFMEPLLPMLILGTKDINNLYVSRKIIESGIAGLAASNRTEEQLLRLKECQKKMKEYYNSYTNESTNIYSSADANFHHVLAEASGNLFLQKIYSVIEVIFKSCISATGKNIRARDASLNEHSQILQAVELKDSDLATTLMKIHILNAQTFYYVSKENEMEKDSK